jgi:hypothetical protein
LRSGATPDISLHFELVGAFVKPSNKVKAKEQKSRQIE